MSRNEHFNTGACQDPSCGLRSYDQHEHVGHSGGPIANVRHGEYRVSVIPVGGGEAMGFASHLPGGDEDKSMSVGEAMFDRHGTLSNIGIAPQHQRRGLGTMMWRAAETLAARGEMPTPKHSVERTDAGEAFARRVGGHFPDEPRRRVFR